jgi:hypothetical protein
MFTNGFVLGQQAPGTLPLQLWFRDYAGPNWDFASVASPDGLAWVKANGYTFTGQTLGYVWPAGTTGL